MYYLRLLVFSTVFRSTLWVLSLLAFEIVFANNSRTLSDANIDKSPDVQGFCFDIIAGKSNIGSILQLKTFNDGIHGILNFTQNKNNVFIQKSESDQFFTPLKSTYENYLNQKLVDSKITTFESVKNKILIQTSNFKFKKPVKSEHPLGLVLSAQMTDLLFSKKDITEIKPEEKIIFQTYSESLGKTQQINSSLETESDYLVLNHSSEGETFSTKHSTNGDLLGSHLKTKNIFIKACTSSSVLTHINSALDNKKFKSLFSFDDRKKLKTCCQHF